MNKTQLIEAVSEHSGLSKVDAGKALDSFMEVTKETLASGGEVSLIGFGTFSVTERAARTGRNPKTGAEIQIAAKKAPKFRAGKALKDLG